MMGNTGSTGFFGGLGRTAKFAARSVGLGILAVLIGIIVGSLTSWKFGLLTFAVIALVAAYYFFRALRQQARNISSVGNFASDFMRDIQRDSSLRDDDSFFGDDLPPLFGTTSRRSPRSTAPRYPASSSQNTGSSAFTTPDISASGADSVSFHKHGSDDSTSRHDGHTIHQDGSAHGSSPSDSSSGSSDTGSSASSDGGSTSV